MILNAFCQFIVLAFKKAHNHLKKGFFHILTVQNHVYKNILAITYIRYQEISKI